MAPQNSTLMNLINDDVKSIIPERFSPITTEKLSNREEKIYEEIPIFIGKTQMRFISGLSYKTTCYDVIKALIDDELANTRTKVVQMKTEPQNYILIERYQDIERVLGSQERIYDLWQNWGENRGDVHFRLKINKRDDHTRRLVENKIKNTGITTLLKKVLHQGDLIQKHLFKIAKYQPCESFFDQSDCCDFDGRNISSYNKATESLDELFLVIENDDNDQDSGVFLTKTQKMDQEKGGHQENREGTLPMHEIFNSDDNFTKHNATQFESVHKDIRSKMCGMKEIIQQEHSFLQKIDRYSFENVTINI